MTLDHSKAKGKPNYRNSIPQDKNMAPAKYCNVQKMC